MTEVVCEFGFGDFGVTTILEPANDGRQRNLVFAPRGVDLFSLGQVADEAPALFRFGFGEVHQGLL